MRLLLASLLYAFSLLWINPALAGPAQEHDLDIHVGFESDEIQIDVSMLVEARPREVWAVLTDFEHMAEFISNLSSSRILARASNLLTIEQKGRTSAGALGISFDSVKEIQLSPFHRIRSHLISGSMKKMEGVTQLSEESGKTRVRFHADAIPGIWLPAFVGRSYIEDETREQFSQMRQEVMRRKQAGTP